MNTPSAASPQRLSMFLNAGVFASEFHERVLDDSFRNGVEVSADIGASALAQLATHVSAYVGAGVESLLLSTIDRDPDLALSVTGGLFFSLRRWDFSAGAGVRDVTDTRRLFVSGQIAFRWGL